MSRVFGVIGAALAVVSVVGCVTRKPAAPVVLDRAAMSRKLLDACVYGEYQGGDKVDRQSMIGDCRCAADKAMKGLDGDSFELAGRGTLTSAQDRALRDGMAACFKAPKR